MKFSLRSFLFVLLLLALAGLRVSQVQANASFLAGEYYVAPDGVYAAAGTMAAPTTLEGARDKIRALPSLPPGGVTVYLRGGVYPLQAAFSLASQDSGTLESPISYRAYPDETPRLSGGTSLEAGWFSQVTAASPVWDRLRPGAQGNTWQVDLSTHGITDWGTLIRRGYEQYAPVSALELAFDGEMMELARWPNRGHSDPFDPEADALVTGNLAPGVAGVFEYIGTQASGNADDGFPNYRRVGLVGGVQYYLYHCTWGDGGQHKYWFISPYSPINDPNCWPTDAASWWGYAAQPYPIPLLEPLSNSSGDALIRTQAEDYAEHGFVRIPDTTSATRFRLPGSRYQDWGQASDLWFQGLFGVYWADDTLVGALESGGFVQLSAEPSYGTVAGQPFFVLNLLEELDTPGEWYLDRSTGMLYFWPPAPLAGAEIAVSLLEEPLLQVEAAHIRFEDIVFELGRADLVNVSGGEDIRFTGCIFRNTGSSGLEISGTGNLVEMAQIYNTGSGGIVIWGGDRPTLANGNNVVRNSEIHHFGRWERTYHPGVRLYGVGNVIQHNEIHHAPHAAILFNGNEHRIEYNEISYVVLEANDAGAIYTGRDWGYRGNRIAYNFIHHVDSIFGGSHAVYLDDAASGITVFGNILYEANGLATLSGGGRDNIFRNNILVNVEGGHETDRRAQRFANNNFNGDGRPNSWNLLGRIKVDFDTFYDNYPILPVIDYQNGVWAARYPELAAIPAEWSQVNDTHWLEPEGSVFACNVAWNEGALLIEGTLGGSGALDWYADTSNNLEADPLFVDEANLDMNLLPGSPAYTLPCFQAIPFDLIGIIDPADFPYRVSLPLVRR